MALISIITPFRNAEKYILETAESILAQTYVDWEWILVNDHSDENENKILEPVLKDFRIKLIENSGNGIVEALETGLKMSNGLYITRMDADDIMPPDKLLHFVQAIETKNVEIVTGKVKYFDSKGQVSAGYLDYENWLNTRVEQNDFYDQIYRECTVSSANWLMKKENLLKCGGFNGLNYPEDYDLLFRWYNHGFRIKGLDELTHLWREHPERTSRNNANYAQEKFFELKVNRFVELDLRSTPLIVNGTGRKGRLTAKILIEKEIPFTWVSIEPEKFKGGLYGQKIVGYQEVCFHEPIQLLNVAKIDSSVVLKLYETRNRIDKVITL